MKKQEIIARHEAEVCAIKASGGKSNRYFTYVKEMDKLTGETKRRQIQKSSREKVEQAIIDYYKSLEEKAKVTLKSLYNEWLDLKILESDSSNNADRLNCDWNRFYLTDKIILEDITRFDVLSLTSWALNKIKDNNLTRKQYNNMATIIRQVLDMAVEKQIIIQNPFKEVRIKNKKVFRKPATKTRETEVFSYEEEKDVTQLAYSDFMDTDYNAPLAICLNFFIGLRLGELVALKKSDINGNYLTVQRSEIKNRVKLDNGKFVSKGVKISEYLKTGDDVRYVFLPQEALKLLSIIEENNKNNRWHCDDYLFLHNNDRIHERAVATRMEKYCKQLGIIQKSPHKIRKTYISSLLDDKSISPDIVRQMAGHKALKTTYENYYFGRQEMNDAEEKFQQALSGNYVTSLLIG